MDYHDETRERLKRFSDQFGALLGMEEQRQVEVSNLIVHEQLMNHSTQVMSTQ